jgi:hypothetical protein
VVDDGILFETKQHLITQAGIIVGGGRPSPTIQRSGCLKVEVSDDSNLISCSGVIL